MIVYGTVIECWLQRSRLLGKSNSTAAILAYPNHILMEHRSGLMVEAVAHPTKRRHPRLRAGLFRVDLLVMADYRHSRLPERLLGGVTRQILWEMNVPVPLAY